MIFGKKRGEEAEGQHHRDLIIAYKKTFSSPHGKEVLFDLMNRYHVLNSHKGDVLAEGARSVVLGILGNCKISLVEFDQMLKGE